MRRRLVPLAALLALGAGGRAAAGEDDATPSKPLLARIADVGDLGREAALAAWNALSRTDRMDLLRPALRSKEAGLAFVAAVVASPLDLDLEELHLQSRALARDPLAPFLPPAALEDVADGHVAFGSKDLLAIWTALAERDPEDFGYERPHRSLLPEDVAALVPLLETAKPRAFRGLLEDLVMEADNEAGDANHETYVRALRYGLARLRAEARKGPRPRLADLPAPPAKAGLPAAFVELATAAWGEKGKDGFDLAGEPPQKSRGEGPWFWLQRWALRLEPAEEDVPFLLSLVRSPRALPQTRAWAARRIAALPGRAAGHAYDLVQAGGGEPAAFAAAERAARGDAAAWGKRTDAVARWLANPDAARRAAWEEIRKGEKPGEITEEERWFSEHDRGVVVRDEDLAWIAEQAAGGELPIDTEAWLLARVRPTPPPREEATRLAASWAARGAQVEDVGDDVRRALATLAAVAPEPTLALLRRWAKDARDPRARNDALALLARLGDAALVDEMLAEWTKWSEPYLLGRVRDPRVEAALRAGTSEGDLEAASEAVQGLAIFHGCPEPLSALLGELAHDEKDPEDAAWEGAKELVLAKDPIGAVLLRTASGPYFGGAGLEDFAGFGLSPDPRVRERLEAWREARGSGLYWPATAALALAGDARCRTEWRAFLGEARAFLLDGLLVGRLMTLDGDPEWVAFWVSRLDANCCHAWHAHTVISATFPTFPYEHAAGGGGRTRAGGERWFARHRGTFVRSPILDGWIPGPGK